MTVKQLREKIANLSDNMDVFISERKTEFTYGLVNSATVKAINFMEDPNGLPLATDEVLVLDEE